MINKVAYNRVSRSHLLTVAIDVGLPSTRASYRKLDLHRMNPSTAVRGVQNEIMESAEAKAADHLHIDESLSSLKKKEWAQLPVSDKIHILKQIRKRITDKPIAWAQATAKVRHEQTVPMTLLSNVLVVTTMIDGLLESLTHFKKTGRFPKASSRTALNGQTVLSVFPRSLSQKFTLLGSAGATVDLYLKRGKPATQGHFYREPHEGKVAALLGAGNQNFLTICDVLHLAFVEGCTVAVKPHPILASVAPYYDYLFEPLASRGYYVSLNFPDIDRTKHFIYNKAIDMVHMTGGFSTHQHIVWGESNDPETQKRMQANQPLLKVPITSELGNVTPWIITPGPWSPEDLEYHGQALAEAVASNVSCNCIAPKVVFLSSHWELSKTFIEHVKSALSKIPLPPPYYPGIRDRYQAFKTAYQGSVTELGAPAATVDMSCGDPLPWLVNEIQWPENPSEEYAFTVEPFAPVITFVNLPEFPGETVNDFLSAAVQAANTHLWGTLSCTVLVHPETQEKFKAAIQRSADDLQYGTIVINTWSAVGYFPAEAHWGGFQVDSPDLRNVGSGIGSVHNSLMYDHSQKCVVWTPFKNPNLQPLPEYVKAPPTLKSARLIAGMVHGGLLGMLKAAFTSGE